MHLRSYTSFDDSLSDVLQIALISLIVTVQYRKVESVSSVDLYVDKPRAVESLRK